MSCPSIRFCILAPRGFHHGLAAVLLGVVSHWLGGAAWAEDWAQFRGPQGTGIGTGILPTTWSNQENLAWRTELPGAGASSPIVKGDKVFLTAYSGYGLDFENPGDRADLRLHVLCLSLSDGKILWKHTLDPAEAEQEITQRVADHGYASPTPCADDRNVYASFGPSGVVALTHDGELLWRRSVGSKTAGFGAAASPIEFEDLVIVNASIEDGALYGIEKSSGEVRWRVEDVKRAWTTPTIVNLPDGSAELVINQHGAILGLSPRTGEQLWSCTGIPDYVVPVIVVDGDQLYCSGGRANKTVRVRAGGRGDVTASHLSWDVARGANVTSPLLLNDHLYWSHDKAIALCLRAEDGKEIYRERMPTRGRVYASIVTDREKLFLTTRDEGVVVLEASPKFRELAVNRLGEEDELFNATPAIAGGRLLLRSDRAIYCVFDGRIGALSHPAGPKH